MHLDVCRYFIELVGNNVSDRNGNGNTALEEILLRRQWLRSMSLGTGPHHCVMYLLRAVAQRGGPAPRVRLPRVVVEFDLYLEEDEMTADDREFRSDAFRRVRKWREAAALQRRLHVRQYVPTNADYDPESKWEPAHVPVAVVEAVARRERGLKRQPQHEGRSNKGLSVVVKTGSSGS